ncbi:leucine-rich repeat protein SHOC-2-like isoform X2 [Rhopilema esculentum]|uniref:leucine-rich repeat protein SHOC-2-like isoform X2 n=1 Tax=Rhopilema esculentum TaxID=499914 RepID=UPI0031D0BA8A
MAEEPGPMWPVHSNIDFCIKHNDDALFLNYMKLNEIPKKIWKIKMLKRLYMKQNLLRNLPNEISLLGSLVCLYLDSNMIENIPQSIGCLPCLESLELSRNEIKEIPTSIGDLPKLKSLHLSHNNLKSLPADLYHLKSITDLTLDANYHLLYIPGSIVLCPKLIYLGLHNCIRPEGDRSNPADYLGLRIKRIGSYTGNVMPLVELCFREAGKLMKDSVNQLRNNVAPTELLNILKRPTGTCFVCNKSVYTSVFVLEKSPTQVLRYCYLNNTPNPSIHAVIRSIPEGIPLLFIFCSLKCCHSCEIAFEEFR